MKQRAPVYVKESFYDPDYLPPEIAANGPPSPEMAGAEPWAASRVIVDADDDDEGDDDEGDDDEDDEDDDEDEE